jgi:transposase InsO family protein
MELAQFVVNAVVLEGRSVKEVARAHDVSESWLYELLARYRAFGEDGLIPRSRRPKRSPTQVPSAMEEAIVALRKHLSDDGYDAGPATIAYHLAKTHREVPSVTTIWRILTRRGFITPEPHKRPKASYVRFEASLPNECWQMDMTHVSLRNGRVAEIVNVIDDYSRLVIASKAFSVTKSLDVVETFCHAAAIHGFPASVLSDNGAIFTASARGDRGAFATELAMLGITFKHSRPYHPETCGKVERFHQTLKLFLGKQRPARSVLKLQDQLDRFVTYYNTIRPHRAWDRKTPFEAYSARVKAGPTGKQLADAVHFRIRHDKVDNNGRITLRHAGRLYHIGIGRPLRGTRVLVLVADLDVRVLTSDGELLRQLTLNPAKNYQAR